MPIRSDVARLIICQIDHLKVVRLKVGGLRLGRSARIREVLSCTVVLTRLLHP